MTEACEATAPSSQAHRLLAHEEGAFFALALGSVGVVFGDIGTKFALCAARGPRPDSRGGGSAENAVLGAVSW